MKHLVIYFLFFLFSLNTFSQACRLGFTFNNSQKEYKGYKQEISYTTDNTKFLVVTGKTTQAAYFFENNVCVLTMVIPLTKSMLHSMIEHYNNTYVIMSDFHWRWYDKGNIIDIELRVDEDDEFYFIYW
jgi:hypothetical protein